MARVGVTNMESCIRGVTGNHRHMPFMHTGRNPGKPLSWVDTGLSLVLRRDGCVRYGIVRYDEW